MTVFDELAASGGEPRTLVWFPNMKARNDDRETRPWGVDERGFGWDRWF